MVELKVRYDVELSSVFFRFNRSMVELKDKTLDEVHRRFFRFNRSMVELKVGNLQAAYASLTGFQSIYGRIERLSQSIMIS